MLLTNTSPANSKSGKRIEAPIPTRRLLENALETNPTSVGPPEPAQMRSADKMKVDNLIATWEKAGLIEQKLIETIKEGK